MLLTPDKIRDLQRKLYQKAKREPDFRFYLLYDKLYRHDILQHAMKLVKTKKGSPGIDGISFEVIEKMEGGVEKYLEKIAVELKEKLYRPSPVKRIYIPKRSGGKRALSIPTIRDRIVQMSLKLIIEPIFEADFKENSYGFRPKRNAHQALNDISTHIIRHKTCIIDADISKCFDEIPHDKLIKTISKRIVDKHILKLLKMFLRSPVCEENDNGKKRIIPNKKGTPQGGVISPLLANIYLNILDKTWKLKNIEEVFGARLVRYADDCVILCKGNEERIFRGFNNIINYLGLSLNCEKTKIVNSREESFSFLGFSIQTKIHPVSGKTFPLIISSKEAQQRVKSRIRELTGRNRMNLPVEDVIKQLNSVVRGWSNYFYYGSCTKTHGKIKNFLELRLINFFRRKRQWKHRSKAFKNYNNKFLYEDLKLYKIPTTAPWKQKVKVFGRK